MRRFVVALLLALGAVSFATPGASADSNNEVDFVKDLTNGKFGRFQAFDVSRNPANPTCVGGVPVEQRITVTSNFGDPNGYPYSSSARQPVDISDGYIQFDESGDPDFPWMIRLFTKSNNELRWDGTTWITQPASGWTTEKPFSTGGNILSASERGFIHISKDTGLVWGGGYGTFYSVTTPLVPGQVLTYTPPATMNTCTNYYTTFPDMTLQPNDGPVANIESLAKLFVADEPLTEPTDETTIKNLRPSKGSLRANRSSVADWEWNLTAAEAASAELQIYPQNPAATALIDGSIVRSGMPISITPPAPGTSSEFVFTLNSVIGDRTQEYRIRVGTAGAGQSMSTGATGLQLQSFAKTPKWAKAVKSRGLTRLVALPIALKSGMEPRVIVNVQLNGKRAIETAKSRVYRVVRKIDGVYLNVLKSRKLHVEAIVTVAESGGYAAFTSSRSWNVK